MRLPDSNKNVLLKRWNWANNPNLFFTVTIGILGSTTEAQEQFKQVPKFVKKKTPLELFLMRKVSCL